MSAFIDARQAFQQSPCLETAQNLINECLLAHRGKSELAVTIENAVEQAIKFATANDFQLINPSSGKPIPTFRAKGLLRLCDLQKTFVKEQTKQSAQAFFDAIYEEWMRRSINSKDMMIGLISIRQFSEATGIKLINPAEVSRQ